MSTRMINSLLHSTPMGPRHVQYDYHFEDWLTLRDVLAGQRVIKLNRERYLPMRTGMDEQDYQGYLQRALFFGITRKSHEALLGSIFRRATTVSVPKQMEYLLTSATPNGEPISSFVQSVTSEALALGRAGILIDMPKLTGTRLSSPHSLISSATPLSRPYFLLYKAEYIMDWKTELDLETNERILTKVVLAEYEDSSETKNHIRVLELYTPGEHDRHTNGIEFDVNLGQRIYRQYVANPTSPDIPIGEISIPTRNGIPLNRIPFYFFGVDGTSETPTQSPLLPIAEINLSHYQSSALLEHARHFVGSPQYWIKMSGISDTEEFLVSSSKIWKLGQDDQVGMIEYHGQGLTFLENSLTQKEQQMASLGAKLFSNQRRQAAMSSKQLETTQNSEESVLSKLVNTMNYQFTKMVKVMAWWMNVQEKEIEEIIVELNGNFDPPAVDARALRALQSLYEAGVYPVSMLYLSFKDAGMIPADMSMEEFKSLFVSQGETPNNNGPIPFQKPEPMQQPQEMKTQKATSSTKVQDPSVVGNTNPGDNRPDQNSVKTNR